MKIELKDGCSLHVVSYSTPLELVGHGVRKYFGGIGNIDQKLQEQFPGIKILRTEFDKCKRELDKLFDDKKIDKKVDLNSCDKIIWDRNCYIIGYYKDNGKFKATGYCGNVRYAVLKYFNDVINKSNTVTISEVVDFMKNLVDELTQLEKTVEWVDEVKRED